MDELRWILLAVGGAILAAIYFSGRFEHEDWKKEREEIKENAANKKVRTDNKTRNKQRHRSSPHFSAVDDSESTLDTSSVISSPEKQQLTKSQPVNQKAPESIQAETHTDSSDKKSADNNIPDVEKTKAAHIKETELEFVAEKETFVEDEIVPVKMPKDLIDAEISIKASKEQEKQQQDNTADKSALPLGVEPLVLAVSVVAEEGSSFDGHEMQEALVSEGLVHGDMKIFHYYLDGNDQEAVFSVANIVEPGIFEIDRLDSFETPGVSLFCQLPGPLPGDEALELMLDKGRGIAVRLGVQLRDDKRNVLTSQAMTHYKDRIATFDHDLALAKKKLEE